MALDMAEETKCTYTIRVTPKGVESSSHNTVGRTTHHTFHSAVVAACVWFEEGKVTTIHKHYADPHKDSVIVAVFDRANGVA